MIVGQELEQNGDEITLTNHINTDDAEVRNWKRVQDGKGFIYSDGKLRGRLVAEIPEDEAAMLMTRNDQAGLDFYAFSMWGDKYALQRLLKRFPHWRASSGGF